ncbi:MAG: S-layer homology domain-containing protein [Lachnospirales bacterium]
MVKFKAKRLTALILSIVLVVSLIPVTANAAEDIISIEETVDIQTIDENTFSLMTDKADIEEGKSYYLTVRRNGDIEKPANVNISSQDITAKYNEDYEISVEDSKTNEFKTDETFIDKVVNNSLSDKDSIDEKIEDIVKENPSILEDSIESGSYVELTTEKQTAVEEDNKTVENTTSSSYYEMTTETNIELSTEPQKAILASIKQQQTGLPTRAISNNSTINSRGLSDIILNNVINNYTKSIDISSSTTLEFQAGEAEKRIKITTKKDGKSEGPEIFELIIDSPSEGYGINSVNKTVLNIKDSDPVEISTLEFSRSKYTADNSNVEITIERKKAEYSFCTVGVRTIASGTAIEGVNYAHLDSVIEMQPNQSEYKFKVPVINGSSETNFGLELYDVKGATIGKVDTTQVIIPEVKEDNENNISLMSANIDNNNRNEEFEIEISGEKYDVVPDTNNKDVAIIYAHGNHSVRVGDYYYVTQQSLNNSNAWGAYTSKVDWSNDVKPSTVRLYINKWRLGSSGFAYYYFAPKEGYFDTKKYQAISVDWKQSNNNKNAISKFEIIKSSDTRTWQPYTLCSTTEKGSFNRNMSEPLPLLEGEKNIVPDNLNNSLIVRCKASAETSNPTIRQYIFGFAALYKSVTVTVNDPDKLTYKDGEAYYDKDGNLKWPTIEKAPAIVGLGYEKNTRITYYYGQSFTLSEQSVDGILRGKRVGYEFSIGSNGAVNKINYNNDKSKDIKIFNLDNNFFKTLDNNTSNVKFLRQGLYTTELSIKPKYTYKDVEVEVLRSTEGTFKDKNLTVGKHIYHIGDSIYIDCETKLSKVADGCSANVYKNYSDTSPLIENSFGVGKKVLDNERYVLTPKFKDKANYIKVVIDKNALDKIHISNTCNLSAAERKKLGLKENEFLLDVDGSNNYEPIVGNIYTIKADVIADAPEGKVYRPVFTSTGSSEVISGLAFDHFATGNANQNIITVSYKSVNKSDMHWFELKGKTVMPGAAIRRNGGEVSNVPISNVTVSAGGSLVVLESKSGINKRIIERPYSKSDINGDFDITGIYAAEGDRITVAYSSRDVQQVSYYTLTSNGLEPTDMKVTEYKYNKDTGKNEAVNVNVKGYIQNTGYEIKHTIKALMKPYVENVTYTVDSEKSSKITNKIDVNSNAIPIAPIGIQITAEVNTNGHQIDSVVFSKVSNSGFVTEYTVSAETENQSYFTLDISSIDEEFRIGDKLYVSIVDKETNNTVNSQVVDYFDNSVKSPFNGKSVIEKVRYTDVFTGLSFIESNITDLPVIMEIKQPSLKTFPIIGDVTSNFSSGSLKMGKETIDDESYYSYIWFAPGYFVNKTTAVYTQEAIKDYNDSLKETKSAQDISDSVNKKLEKKYENLADVPASEVAKTEADVKKELQSTAHNKAISDLGYTLVQGGINIGCVSLYHFVSNDKLANDLKPKYPNGTYLLSYQQTMFGGQFNADKCTYWSFMGVPIYIDIEGNVALDVNSGVNKGLTKDQIETYDNIADIKDGYLSLVLTLELTLRGGVGVYGVVGIRGIVNANLVYSYIKNETYPDGSYGGIIEANGGFGYDLLLVSGEYLYNIATARLGYLALDETSTFASINDEEIYTRNYNSGDSNLSTFGQDIKLLSTINADTTYHVLKYNAAERTRPQVVSFGNKVVLFFLNANENGVTSLYYSIMTEDAYGNEIWSTPQIIDKDGTQDTMPNVTKFGDKCVISWMDRKNNDEIINSDADSLKNAYNNSEVSYAIFNSKTDTISSEYKLTDDTFMDSSLQIGADSDGIEFAYYLKSDITNSDSIEKVSDVNANYSTVTFRKYDKTSSSWGEEEYLNIPCEGINDPLVVDFNSIATKYNGVHYALLTYTVDMDKDLNTDSDREVYLMITDVDNNKKYYPIRLTKDSELDVKPNLTLIGDDIYISWVHGENNEFSTINLSDIVNYYNNTGALDILLSKDTSKPDWYKIESNEINYSTIDDNDLEFNDSIFYMINNNNVIMNSHIFYDDEGQPRNIKDYKILADADGLIYVFWSEGDRDSGQNIYCSYYEKDLTDGSGGWSDVIKLTNVDETIDEFTATFDNNGDMLLFSNLFKTSYDKDKQKIVYSQNKLVSFDSSDFESILTSEEGIVFDEIPRAGDIGSITINLKNNSLTDASNCRVTLYTVQNGTEEMVASLFHNNIIAAGSSDTFDLIYMIPDKLDDLKLKAVVEYSCEGSEKYKSFTLEKQVSFYDNLQITNCKAYYNNGLPYLSLNISNNGNKDSSPLKISAYKYNSENTDKLYGTYNENPIIPADGTLNIEYPLEFLNGTDLDDMGRANIKIIINDGDNIKESYASIATSSIASITFSDSNISMKSGESVQLNPNVYPKIAANDKLYYFSINPDIVKVDDKGKVTACKAGKAIVAVCSDNFAIGDYVEIEVSGTINTTNEETTETTTEITTIPIPTNSSGAGVMNKSKEVITSCTETTTELTTAAVEFVEETTAIFNDIDGHWAKNYIEELAKMGFIKGISASTFAPNNSLTRAQAVQFLRNLNIVNSGTKAVETFKDVPNDAWYSDSINWAVENEIAQGIGNGKFEPDKEITREEMALMIQNFINKTSIKFDANHNVTFTDVDLISDWAYDAVVSLASYTILNGRTNGQFDPKANITRGEMSVIISNILKFNN